MATETVRNKRSARKSTFTNRAWLEGWLTKSRVVCTTKESAKHPGWCVLLIRLVTGKLSTVIGVVHGPRSTIDWALPLARDGRIREIFHNRFGANYITDACGIRELCGGAA